MINTLVQFCSETLPTQPSVRYARFQHWICSSGSTGEPQVAQARYMSSSMWTFALLRDSSDLHIYKDLYGERSKPEKKRKITVELQ